MVEDSLGQNYSMFSFVVSFTSKFSLFVLFTHFYYIKFLLREKIILKE